MIAGKPYLLTVAGVSFAAGYPGNLHTLAELVRAAGHTPEPVAVVMRRNPQNPHDSNAIEVHVPALGEFGMVGHIPAKVAVRLAGELDDGAEVRAWVHHVRVDPAHADRPGLMVAVVREFTEDEAKDHSDALAFEMTRSA